MFPFLNMALMGLQNPMQLAMTMAQQNIAPQMMQQAIGQMAQPQMMAGGVSQMQPPMPIPDTSMGVPGAGAMNATGPGTQVASLDGSIFDEFMNTVKSQVNNPHGLAAIAATGMRESGFSAGNAFRSWDDVGKPAGGIMSWRAERLNNLMKFGGSEGDMKGLSPTIQGQFFLQEDPALIAKLNAAQSDSEAMTMMNNAWQFDGFNNPESAEYQHRMQTVGKIAPLFQASAAQTPGTGDASVMEASGLLQQEKADKGTLLASLMPTSGSAFTGGEGGVAAAKPQTLADKLAAIGKGVKVPEGGGGDEQGPPRITGGLAPNVGGGFGRNPQSIEQLFAMLGGNTPQATIPSLSQLIRGG